MSVKTPFPEQIRNARNSFRDRCHAGKGQCFEKAPQDRFKLLQRHHLLWPQQEYPDPPLCVIGSAQRWSCFLRQAVKVDSAMKRVIHHEDAETVFGCAWAAEGGMNHRAPLKRREPIE